MNAVDRFFATLDLQSFLSVFERSNVKKMEDIIGRYAWVNWVSPGSFRAFLIRLIEARDLDNIIYIINAMKGIGGGLFLNSLVDVVNGNLLKKKFDVTTISCDFSLYSFNIILNGKLQMSADFAIVAEDSTIGALKAQIYDLVVHRVGKIVNGSWKLFDVENDVLVDTFFEPSYCIMLEASDPENQLKYQKVEPWEVHCSCRANDDDGEFMIECSSCHRWSHIECSIEYDIRDFLCKKNCIKYTESYLLVKFCNNF